LLVDFLTNLVFCFVILIFAFVDYIRFASQLSVNIFVENVVTDWGRERRVSPSHCGRTGRCNCIFVPFGLSVDTVNVGKADNFLFLHDDSHTAPELCICYIE
jgi:hypothetical protein